MESLPVARFIHPPILLVSYTCTQLHQSLMSTEKALTNTDTALTTTVAAPVTAPPTDRMDATMPSASLMGKILESVSASTRRGSLGVNSNLLRSVIKIFAVRTEPNLSMPWQMKRQYRYSSPSLLFISILTLLPFSSSLRSSRSILIPHAISHSSPSPKTPNTITIR